MTATVALLELWSWLLHASWLSRYGSTRHRYVLHGIWLSETCGYPTSRFAAISFR